MYVLVSLAAALPGAACAGANGLPGGKHNTRTPIEVTSDSLEVMQEQNKAAFTGHVVAIQGAVRLKADKMTVYYANPEDKKAEQARAKKSKKDGKNPEAAIRKIEAEGNVFLSTPMETASGAKGIYDVERQEIHLNDRVVLTRGKNVLKGDKLTYGFASGKSVLTGGDAAPDGKKERVRALFVPEGSTEGSKDKE